MWTIVKTTKNTVTWKNGLHGITVYAWTIYKAGKWVQPTGNQVFYSLKACERDRIENTRETCSIYDHIEDNQGLCITCGKVVNPEVYEHYIGK